MNNAACAWFLKKKIKSNIFSVFSRRNPPTGFPVAFAKVVYKVSISAREMNRRLFILHTLSSLEQARECVNEETVAHFGGSRALAARVKHPQTLIDQTS